MFNAQRPLFRFVQRYHITPTLRADIMQNYKDDRPIDSYYYELGSTRARNYLLFSRGADHPTAFMALEEARHDVLAFGLCKVA